MIVFVVVCICVYLVVLCCLYFGWVFVDDGIFVLCVFIGEYCIDDSGCIGEFIFFEDEGVMMSFGFVEVDCFVLGILCM